MNELYTHSATVSEPHTLVLTYTMNFPGIRYEMTGVSMIVGMKIESWKFN